MMADGFRYVISGLLLVVSALLSLVLFWFKGLQRDMMETRKELVAHKQVVASDYVKRSEVVGRIEDVNKSVNASSADVNKKIDTLSSEVKELTKAIYKHIGQNSAKE